MTTRRHFVSSAILVALCCAASLVAQPPAVKPPALDYKPESSIIEQMDTLYTVAADGTGSKQITGVIRLQNEAAIKSWSVLSFDFASSAEHVEIDYVRVRRPDGTLVSTPAADAQEMPAAVTREAPFYSDLKEEQIPVRSLQAGDHLEYKLRIVRTRPEAPNHFWGQESFFTPSSVVVVLSETVELQLPATAYIQVWSPNFKPTVSDTAGNRLYSWQSAQLLPVAGKDKNALLKLEKDPAVAADPETRLPDIAWTNFHNWEEVGAWYRGMEGSRAEPDDDVRARVTELITGKSSAEDKTRAVYGFVGPQVRYIGVAFGVGRYQPHEAGDVLRNQYGDCKDKHTLLAAMLSAANVNADAVLICAGIPFNEAVPSPGAFNHVITLAHVDNQPVWLDATAEVAPYRLLNPEIRNKRALVVPLTGDPHLETTPKDLPFHPETHFEATGSLDDQGTSHSHMVMDLRGDDEIPFRQAVRSVSPAQWDELMQRISYAMSYAGKVTNAEFSRPDDTSAPFHVTYDYEREKSGDWDNLRILPQLPPVGLGDADEKDPPIVPIELGSPHVEIAHTVMKLPAGWGAELPPAVHAKAAFATLDKTYKLDKGSLFVDRRIEIFQEKLPASDWAAYHQWFKDASLDGESYVQLTRVVGSRAAVENNPDAAQLINEVQQLEQDKSWEAARAKLDRAKALNNRQAYLWSNYGFLAEQYGKRNEAIEDFRKEISYHPDEFVPYRLLAFLQMSQHNTKDASATLQQFLTHDPGDENAAQMLSSILVSQMDYNGAEAVLRSATAANDSSLQLKLTLADALLHDQKAAAAKPLLEAIVSKSNDPGDLNNAAYALADNSLDLPLAEKSARRALELLDEASNAGETGAPALRRSTLLLATWDTYGWILFREDKAADAEPWIRAAWRNGLDAEPGYHLGMVLEKTSHPSEALDIYRLAAQGAGGENAATVHDSIQARIDALQNTAHPANDSAAPHSLQDARTYHVSRPEKVTPFWADVEFEVTTSGTAAARYVDSAAGNPAMLPAVQAVDLHLAIPKESHARLFRRGILSCHSSPGCDLVLEFPRDSANE